MKKSAIFLLSIFACYAESNEIPNEQNAPSDCSSFVCQPPAQMVISHNFGRGVGHKGYSSLDFFFIRAKDSRLFPYVDARLHELDSGRFAANAGLGFRYLTLNDSFSVGANAYYDYRNSKSLNTNQVGAGIELLSQHLDFRVNGYLPFSGKSHTGGLKFAGFSGHQVDVREHTRYAFPSANAELGIPLPWISSGYVDSYVGVGPYYLFGKHISGSHYQNSWGGKFRFEMNVTDYATFQFELNTDRVYKTRCQGVVAINIPLYKKSACVKNCTTIGRETYYRRTLRPPVRNEIIPVKSKNEKRALRDANGDLLQAFFVNNAAACPGLGTFESPFCTLGQASAAPAGALIYVFEGNSVASPYQGVTMAFGQTLQGSGTPLTIDGVTIPPQTAGMPHVENNEITVASSTTVQGFFINAHDLAAGIQGNNVSDVRILNNVIINSMQHGIWFPSHSGSLYIAGNSVSNSAQNGISIDTSGPGFTQVLNNTLVGNGGSGVLIRLDDPNSTGLVQGNVFIDNVSFSIGTEVAQGVLTIDSNIMTTDALFAVHALDGIQYFTNNRVTSVGMNSAGLSYDITNAGTGPRQAYFYNNHVTMLGTGSIGIVSHTFTTAGTIYTEVVNNTSTSATPANGIIVETFTGPSSVCGSIIGNTSSGIQVNGTAGPVNIQQTQVQYQTDNNAPTTSSGTVNFGSSCTP
jgi:hypothetical protein